jgi:hypothetical protein
MNNVAVKETGKTDTILHFNISMDASEYEVDASESYIAVLTGGKISPADLIRRSFEFLLAREPKESILKSFNLKQIQTYFPEYENEMKRSAI